MLALAMMTAALAYPPAISDWETLADGDVWVGCAEAEGQSWCRAISEIPMAQPSLAAIINDIENYPSILKRVSSSRRLSSNAVHITLDMPFPVSSRDYVARFKITQEGDVKVFTYQSVVHPDAPEVPGVVRLPNAGGEWRLEPVSPTSTKLTYTWNAELGGDFPEWALPQAWSTQGKEVMGWLTDAAE